jgi:hypothetical protein
MLLEKRPNAFGRRANLTPQLDDDPRHYRGRQVTRPALLMPTIDSGKAVLLMVTNPERTPMAPDVPMAEETGAGWHPPFKVIFLAML